MSYKNKKKAAKKFFAVFVSGKGTLTQNKGNQNH